MTNAHVAEVMDSLKPGERLLVRKPGDAQSIPVKDKLGHKGYGAFNDFVDQAIATSKGFEGDVMVLNGDVPLAGAELLGGLRRRHVDCTARATITSVVLADPGHYGRVIRDSSGDVARIVEARDASPGQLAVAEINVGFYVFDAAELRKAEGLLGKLDESQRSAVEAMTAQIVNKLLHLPTVRMKQAAAAADGVIYADAVRHLFGLEEDR